MKLPSGTKLVMIGDSITDCDRARPIGEGLGESLGRGYVALVEAFLGAFLPENPVRIVNMGVGGNTVIDLKERWKTDVLDLSPDWLSVMIGINDVWRQFHSPRLIDKHVSLDLYETTLNELVAQTRPALKGLVLMTPFYIESRRDDLMRLLMDEYGAAVKRIAKKHDALFVDTQAAFDQVLEHCYPASLAWDRVHPSLTGHMVIARAFLTAIEFSL